MNGTEHCGRVERPCSDEFAEINRKLDTLDEAVRGNGKPGIRQRLDRLEEAHASARRLLWCLIGCAAPILMGATWKLLISAGGG